MPTEVEALARIRGTTPLSSVQPGGLDRQAELNTRGDLLVAQAMPPDAELLRMGNSYSVITTAAVAPVSALPTTTAQLSLWNGEADNGAWYVIDSIFGIVVVSSATQMNLGMAHMLNIGKITKPTPSALVIKGLSGKPYAGKGSTSLATTVADDGWVPVGDSITPGSATVQLGAAVDKQIKGAILVPPGGLYSIVVLCSVVAAITVRQGIRFHEVLFLGA